MTIDALLDPPHTPEHTIIPSATFHAPVDNLVIMPQSIANAIFPFTMETKEYSFIMLYKPEIVNGHEVDPIRYRQDEQVRLVPIEVLIATGEGGIASVSHDPNRLDVINQFLDENPEYRSVEVHTHTDTLGPYWAENFSSGDLDAYTRNANVVKDYLAALVTPTRIKFWPDYVSTTIKFMGRYDIEQSFPGFTSDVAQVRNRLTAIAGNRLDINYFLFE